MNGESSKKDEKLIQESIEKLKEEKLKIKEKRKEEKEKLSKFMKEWSKKKEDLELENLKVSNTSSLFEHDNGYLLRLK